MFKLSLAMVVIVMLVGVLLGLSILLSAGVAAGGILVVALVDKYKGN